MIDISLLTEYFTDSNRPKMYFENVGKFLRSFQRKEEIPLNVWNTALRAGEHVDNFGSCVLFAIFQFIRPSYDIHTRL